METAENQHAAKTNSVDCSIIIPVYFNEGALKPTIRSLDKEVFQVNSNRSFEVIFIDDGSKDKSFQELLQIKKNCDYTVKIIKLTRNFGQTAAIMAGFGKSSGNCVVVISADGQDPPELINEMLAAHDSGAEIVIAARDKREESRFRTLSSRLFYTVMRKLSFDNMPQGGFDFFLLGKRPLEAIMKNKEAHPFIQGQILWTGFSMETLKYTRRKREVGVSRWSFGKKLTYLLDGVLSYSYFPIRVMSAVGGLIAFTGMIYALIIFFSWLVWGNPVTGWAPIMIVILVVTGFQLLMLGVIGEYLWRTLAQVRQREPYLIESVHE